MKRFYFLLVISLIINSLPFLGCKANKTNSQDVDIAGMVLFLVGEVKTKTTSIYSGDILSHQDIIQVGAKSNCDIQVHDTEPNYTVRIQQNSEFGFLKTSVDGEMKYVAFIKEGKAQFNIVGPNPDGKSKLVITPDSKIKIKGTQFDVEVDKTGKTKVTLYEGSIIISPSIKELVEVKPEVLHKSKEISSIQESLDKKELILTPGNEIVMNNSPIRNEFEKMGILQELKNPNPSFEKIKIEDVEKIFSKNELVKTETKSIPKKQIDSMLQVFKEELAPLKTQKFTSKDKTIQEMKSRNREIKTLLTARIAGILEEKPKTVLMRNGNKITGVITEKNSKLFILTADGEEELKEDEIQELLF